MATKVEDIRNIALVGHGSSGKTTLADNFLITTGEANGNHSVDDGTSICDFDEEEKEHKYSIEAAVTHFQHAGKQFHVLDAPGYPDLIGQAISALRATDTALLCIDAHAGIKVNTRRMFQEAEKAGVGRIILINKLDADNIDFPALVESIREVFGIGCVLLNVPLGLGADFKGVASTLKLDGDASGAVIAPASINESLVESIIEVDEEVTERYFEGQMPTDEEMQRLMVRAIAEGSLIPIVCASSKSGVGVKELLDVLAQCALPPTAVKRTATRDGETVAIEAKPDGPLVAQVFKTRIDPFVQRLSYIRVYSGTLKKETTVPATGSRKGVKIAQLLAVQGGETKPVDEAGPGEIVAVAKVEELKTGCSLGDMEMSPMEFPRPMVGLAIAPKTRGTEAKLSTALHKIVEEDSTISLDHDEETKEMVLHGMSELHLTLIQQRLIRRDKVEVSTREPKIPYRETIQANAEGSYRHKKQSGGAGQFGEVHIRMYPFPEGADPEEFATKDRFPQLKSTHYHADSNFLWVDSVVGATIPGNFMPAVEKGFLERISRGVVAGYPVQNVCVEVHYGKHHPVDSNETAFKKAGSMAFRDVFLNAHPALLEPIVKLEVTVPNDNVGDVSSDFSGRRGRMMGMEAAGGGLTTIEAEAPLSEVTTYARTLSSMTGGQGSYTMEFARYEPVPGNVQKEIIDKAAHKEEEED
ncbi:MAG: elongation factor G [Planctomycetales bacterium]|nr:elongation factor G [Planctomycetales bacterium]